MVFFEFYGCKIYSTGILKQQTPKLLKVKHNYICNISATKVTEWLRILIQISVKNLFLSRVMLLNFVPKITVI
jgi:hypothetical protein